MQKLFFILMFFIYSTKVFSQIDTLKNKKLNLFLDCDYYCDIAYIKEHILYVNYVRDRKEADVHLLVTNETNGSGGASYTFYFIGLQTFSTKKDTLTVSFKSDATSEEKRNEFVNIIEKGLFQFVIHTKESEKFSINYISEKEESIETIDKWNNWVFDISLDGYLNVDNNYSNLYLYSSLSANKVTEKWKISISGGNNFVQSVYKYDDDTITVLNTSYYFQNKTIRSLSNHFSIGGSFKFSNSSYGNYKYNVKIYPAIEYNIFPYKESNRKIISLMYSVGYNHATYYDTTIYNKIKENLFAQNFLIYFKTVQEWGNADLTLSASNYLHDFSKNRLDISSSLNFRVFKGFSVYLYGSYSFIHNQLNIPKYDASLEEILTQQRMLETNYSIWVSFGLSYTFGSIYNNVVNPRLSKWYL
jgi:hypothetical protein